MYVAIMETEHYTWTAGGRTEAQARAGIREAWRQHHELLNFDYQIKPSDLDEWYGINVLPIQEGHGYRDGTKLTKEAVA